MIGGMGLSPTLILGARQSRQEGVTSAAEKRQGLARPGPRRVEGGGVAGGWNFLGLFC